MAAQQLARGAISNSTLIKNHPDKEHIKRAIDRISSILSNVENLSVSEFQLVLTTASETLNQVCRDIGEH